MNFRVGRFFYLTISFIIGAFFLAIGIINLVLPWSTRMKDEIVRFIWEDTLILPLFGLGLISIGLSIIIYTFISSRHRYLHIKTGSRSVVVDENVIQNYLEAYWQEQFPNSHIPSHFKVKKDSIQIVADLPYLPQPEQKDFLERVSHDFKDIFGRLLGYHQEIQLIASFQDEK